jgi:phage tail protein X
MNALVTFLRANIPRGRRRRRRGARRRSSPRFLEPSVTVTPATTEGQQQQQQQQQQDDDDNTLDDEENKQDYYLSFLYQLCKRWAWPAVIFRTQELPHEAHSATDGNGDTMLHWTCFGSPPLEVVEALLRANPKLATVANRRGNLPLHVACSYRASSSIIRLLVQVHPESVDMANGQGSYPLHILCDYGCPTVDSIRAILEVSVRTVRLEDALFRRTPLLILNERKNLHEFHDSLHTLRIMANNNNNNNNNNALGGGYHHHRTSPSLPSLTKKDTLFLARCRRMVFWKKASLLILAEHSKRTLPKSSGNDNDNDNDNDNENNDEEDDDTTSPTRTTTGIVHACLHINHCPPALLEFAVLVRANELLLPDDTTGQLPLHVAVQQCNVTTIMDLLNANPEAARIPNPTTTTTTSRSVGNTTRYNNNNNTNNNKLPLQVLLERFPDSPWAGVVNPFVSANPTALESLNLDKRFYPLIWAKLIIAKKDLDTIFESMRCNPMLLV